MLVTDLFARNLTQECRTRTDLNSRYSCHALKCASHDGLNGPMAHYSSGAIPRHMAVLQVSVSVLQRGLCHVAPLSTSGQRQPTMSRYSCRLESLEPIYPLNFPGHAGWQSTFDQTMFRSQGLRQGEIWNMPNSSLLIDKSQK